MRILLSFEVTVKKLKPFFHSYHYRVYLFCPTRPQLSLIRVVASLLPPVMSPTRPSPPPWQGFTFWLDSLFSLITLKKLKIRKKDEQMKNSLDPKLSFESICYIEVFPIKDTKLLFKFSLEIRVLITEITVKRQNVDPCDSADPLSIPLNTDLIRAKPYQQLKKEDFTIRLFIEKDRTNADKPKTTIR